MPKIILNVPDIRDETWGTPVTILENISDFQSFSNGEIHFKVNGKRWEVNMPYAYEIDTEQ